jgi:hypothetical protein
VTFAGVDGEGGDFGRTRHRAIPPIGSWDRKDAAPHREASSNWMAL